jgi:exonuclease SbcC
VIATLGAALALAGLVIAGVLILVAGVALIVWATMRSGNAAQERALALEELNRAREALGATGHALEEARKRLEEAQSRASTLGVSVEPAALLRIADEMAVAALAERDLERWTAQRDGLAERAGRAEAALRTALGARDVDGGADLSGAVAAYEQACRERARTWREAARRPDLEKRLADRREKEQAAAEIARRRAAASERLREVADQCGVAGESVEALLEGLVQWRGQWAEEIREREQASREWVELEEKLNGRTLSALIEEAARYEEIAARLAEGLSPERLASIALEHDPRSQLERLSRANLNAVGALEQMRGRLKESRAGLVSVPEAEEAVAAGKAEVARLRDLDRILELTRTYLAAAQERVHRDIAPVLAQSVRRWLPRITKGRYVDVRVDPKTLNVYARTKEGNSRLASLLSHGTAEQIYLMLRVALAERLTKPGEVCPLVLDDVTVQADRERTIAVLEMLHEISKERQVILFTQEDDVKDWAERNLLEPRDRVERLVISQ